MTINVGTFNVYGANGNRLNRICDIIKKLDLDIIGFQEIEKRSLETLAKRLKMQSIWTDSCHLGNGLLVENRYKISDYKTHKLKVSGKYETRSAIRARCETSYGSITVVTIHLDHISEDVRMEQWKQLEYMIPESTDIIMGDFNSLYLDDYSDEELKVITDDRAESDWEVPTDKLTKHIVSSGWNLHEYSGWTSRFKTRVDYILYSSKWKANQMVHDTMKLSDHRMVTASIEKK